MGDYIDGVYYDDTSLVTPPFIDGSGAGSTTYFGNYDKYGNYVGPGYNPYGTGTYGSGSTVGGSDFWTALTKGITNATSILGVRYAVPQLNPGQVIQTGPGGTSFMSQAQAGGALQTTTLGGIGSGTLLLLVGAGLVAFMVMGGKGH